MLICPSCRNSIGLLYAGEWRLQRGNENRSGRTEAVTSWVAESVAGTTGIHCLHADVKLEEWDDVAVRIIAGISICQTLPSEFFCRTTSRFAAYPAMRHTKTAARVGGSSRLHYLLLYMDLCYGLLCLAGPRLAQPCVLPGLRYEACLSIGYGGILFSRKSFSVKLFGSKPFEA